MEATLARGLSFCVSGPSSMAKDVVAWRAVSAMALWCSAFRSVGGQVGLVVVGIGTTVISGECWHWGAESIERRLCPASQAGADNVDTSGCRLPRWRRCRGTF